MVKLKTWSFAQYAGCLSNCFTSWNMHSLMAEILAAKDSSVQACKDSLPAVQRREEQHKWSTDEI